MIATTNLESPINMHGFGVWEEARVPMQVQRARYKYTDGVVCFRDFSYNLKFK